MGLRQDNRPRSALRILAETLHRRRSILEIQSTTPFGAKQQGCFTQYHLRVLHAAAPLMVVWTEWLNAWRVEFCEVPGTFGAIEEVIERVSSEAPTAQLAPNSVFESFKIRL